MAKTSAEDHIRAYLAFLADPTSIIDQTAVTKAQAKAERAKDPILKVKALSELERAESPDGWPLVDAFVKHVAEWVETEGVTVQALRTVGVPDDVLAQAGLVSLDAARPAKKAAKGKKTPVVSEGRRRQPSIGLDDVAKLLPDDVFTTTDLELALNRNYQTVRNYIARLVDANVVEQLGQDPEWTGKGRAPMRYRRAG